MKKISKQIRFTTLVYAFFFFISIVLIHKNIFIFNNNKGINFVFMQIISFVLTVFISVLVFRKKNQKTNQL